MTGAGNFLATAIAIEQSATGDVHLNAHIYEALGYQVWREPRKPGGIAWRRRGRGSLDEYAWTHWASMSRLTNDASDAYDHLLKPLAPASNISLDMNRTRAVASMVLPLGSGMIQSRAKTPALALSGLAMRLMHWREETPLDAQAMALARHALGFQSVEQNKSYRNRYCAWPTSGSGLVAEKMVSAGLATRDVVQETSTIYALTFEGAIRALKPGESLCAEDFRR